MTYKKLIDTAKQLGTFTEKAMWQSVENVSQLIEKIKDIDLQLYWDFMRKQHGIMYNNHYTEDYAMYDVAKLCHAASDGKKRMGEYWSVEDIEKATSNVTFPDGVNRWDKYVAYNSAHSDYCKHFDDTQILKIAYDFFFADEDYTGNDKVWRYMCMTHGC